jgi:glycosyltransferase involved in cell wall biosynthesis
MNNKDSIKATIIIPAYNEETGIKETLNNIINTISNDSYELIVVDDCSKDKTVEIVTSFESVNLIQHTANKGYGAALKTGINKANNDIICITDADGTYPNEKIPNFVSQLVENGLDMVVGTRTGKNVNIPFLRKPPKWGIGKLANWVTGMVIPDVNSGLRVFKKSSFSSFINIVPDGFSFTTTITIGMLSGGYKVKFIPIDYFHRLGKSKIRPIRDTLNFIKLILKIGLYFAPLKIFIPLSVGLFMFALGWGVFTKVVLGELADVSSLIIAMTGFQVLVLALIAELINHRLPNKYRK